MNRKHKSNKYFSILVIILIVIIASVAIIYFIRNKNQKNDKEITTTIEETSHEEEKETIFTITALGDILCHNTQYMDAYNSSTKTYDFSYVFDDIKDYTQAGDLTIANLETSFAGEERGYSNYPTFNSPDALAYAMKGIGVDIITTAGNHALDMGYTGLERTIDVLDNAGIEHLGTYKSQEEKDSVFIKDVKGVKIAFIDYTYGTNGIPVPKDKEYCINITNKDAIRGGNEWRKQ